MEAGGGGGGLSSCFQVVHCPRTGRGKDSAHRLICEQGFEGWVTPVHRQVLAGSASQVAFQRELVSFPESYLCLTRALLCFHSPRALVAFRQSPSCLTRALGVFHQRPSCASPEA